MRMIALRIRALSDRIRSRRSVVGIWGDLWWPREHSVHPQNCGRCVVPPGSHALTSDLCAAVDSWKAVPGACWSVVETKDLEAALNPLPYSPVTQYLLGSTGSRKWPNLLMSLEEHASYSSASHREMTSYLLVPRRHLCLVQTHSEIFAWR